MWLICSINHNIGTIFHTEDLTFYYNLRWHASTVVIQIYPKTLKTMEKPHMAKSVLECVHNGMTVAMETGGLPPPRRTFFSLLILTIPFCMSGLSVSSCITFSTDQLNSMLKSGCGPRGVVAVGVHVRVLVWKSRRRWCVGEGGKQCYVNIFICEDHWV